METEKVQFENWFSMKFLQWQVESGKRRTVSDWADYLNLPRSKVSHWLLGRHLPSRSAADVIAARLGPETYEILGIERPDTDFQQVVTILRKKWDSLSKTERERILRCIQESSS